MPRKTVIINFSADPDLALMIKRQAELERKTRSELLRDALQGYFFDQRLKKIQEIGEVIAQKLGLDSYDEIEKYLG